MKSEPKLSSRTGESDLPDMFSGGMLPLVEEFYTLQGEGFHTGRAAWFIRLGGCDVGCSWCDARQTWNPRLYPPVEVGEIVRRATADNPARAVVITGGEPLMYPLDGLCEGLHASGIEIFLETSGSHPFSGSFDWVCLSPKRRLPPLDEAWSRADELKVIVEGPEDLPWAEECAARVMAARNAAGRAAVCGFEGVDIGICEVSSARRCSEVSDTERNAPARAAVCGFEGVDTGICEVSSARRCSEVSDTERNAPARVAVCGFEGVDTGICEVSSARRGSEVSDTAHNAPARVAVCGSECVDTGICEMLSAHRYSEVSDTARNAPARTFERNAPAPLTTPAVPRPAPKLFLQPEWSRRDEVMPLIVNYIKENPRWRSSLQSHKYMRIP